MVWRAASGERLANLDLALGVELELPARPQAERELETDSCFLGGFHVHVQRPAQMLATCVGSIPLADLTPSYLINMD